MQRAHERQANTLEINQTRWFVALESHQRRPPGHAPAQGLQDHEIAALHPSIAPGLGQSKRD